MTQYTHSTTSKTKLITLREWGNRFVVKPASISWHLEQYRMKAAGNYNPYDIYSVLDFHSYLLKIWQEKATALRLQKI
jgi:hypothetical protein